MSDRLSRVRVGVRVRVRVRVWISVRVSIRVSERATVRVTVGVINQNLLGPTSSCYSGLLQPILEDSVISSGAIFFIGRGHGHFADL